MIKTLAYRINLVLERHLPEQRLFLKSDSEMRFIRLRPATQAIAITFGAMALAWTILATAILLMDSISAGTSRTQIARQQTLYEQRLTSLSSDLDLRSEEAASAQNRFNLALVQVSEMQARLLASEDRRRELETGIEVIQNTLRGTIAQRDDARAQLASLSAEKGIGRNDQERLRDSEATVEFLSASLGSVASERDQIEAVAAKADERVAAVVKQKQALEAQNEEIFSKLEEALTVSVEPLEKMFVKAGLSPDSLLSAVRKGYSGAGGPILPITFSAKGLPPSADQQRAKAILEGLDTIGLYRLAAFKTPFAMPVKDRVRMSSGFGRRNDPISGARKMHEGQDFAGAYGTAIFATADGTVVHAGWQSGYGQLIRIKHAFGLETRFGHLSKIRVKVGQKVSRGERIGDMGNTGRSTGTHLHYEIRLNGSAINPMTFIKAATNVF